MSKTEKKKKKKKWLKAVIGIIVVLAAIAAFVFVFSYFSVPGDSSLGTQEDELLEEEKDSSEISEGIEVSEEADTAEETETSDKSEEEGPAEATIGVTGDIILHDAVLESALNEDGTYDFSECFEAVSSYWEDVDYMIANLEVTITDDGDYSGYPYFSSPSAIVSDLKDAGIDCLLTANNHCYDSGDEGIYSTLEAIEAEGLDYTGTRSSSEDSYVIIKDINGIVFGLVCYTFDTRYSPDDEKSMNGLTLSDEAGELINSFCYWDLEDFYARAQESLNEMEEAGCDVTIFFMHWGTEYQEEPNDYQTQIAQGLSDLGVDVIVGSHPHVVQEFDVLTGESGNETLVLYSMGNALSNQRRDEVESVPDGYTEDGVIFELTYTENESGEVELTEIYILPTWVELNEGSYSIVPLDYKIAPESWTVYDTEEAEASYNRTLERLGEIYPSLRLELGNEEVLQTLD